MKRLTRAEVRAIDQRAIQEFGIPEILLVENAARAVADAAMEMLAGKSSIVIFVGGGNNGADGLAAARHLSLAGYPVTIVAVFNEQRLSAAAKLHRDIAQAMRIPFVSVGPIVSELSQDKSGLIIDALLGTGATTPPREEVAAAINMMNRSSLPILAVDLPSGLDCETGEALGAQCVRATRTVTFAGEKIGFARTSSRIFTGEIVVAGIGCPLESADQRADAHG